MRQSFIGLCKTWVLHLILVKFGLLSNTFKKKKKKKKKEEEEKDVCKLLTLFFKNALSLSCFEQRLQFLLPLY